MLNIAEHFNGLQSRKGFRFRYNILVKFGASHIKGKVKILRFGTLLVKLLWTYKN